MDNLTRVCTELQAVIDRLPAVPPPALVEAAARIVDQQAATFAQLTDLIASPILTDLIASAQRSLATAQHLGLLPQERTDA